MLHRHGITHIPVSVNYNDKIAKDPKSQGFLFPEYFSKILNESSVVTHDEESESFLEPLGNFDIFISTIENVCSCLVTSKATRQDGIPAILFKICGKSRSESLCQIKQTGVHPAKWKQATVRPTFKQGSKSTVENYRQASLQCIVSKIFERILFNVSYENLQPIRSLSHFGFRKDDHALFRWSSTWNFFTMPTIPVKISTSYTETMRKHSIKWTTVYCYKSYTNWYQRQNIETNQIRISAKSYSRLLLY